MSKMKLVLDVVNDLRSLAESIETLAGAIEGTDAKAKLDKEEQSGVQQNMEMLPTLEEVRAKLAVLSQNGKQVQVKELITEFRAKKLSDIPAERYPELLEKVEVL